MLKSTVEAMLAVRKAADVCDMPGEAHILRMAARELDTFDVPEPSVAIGEFEAIVSALTVVHDRSNSNALDEALDNALSAVRALLDDAHQSANPPLVRVVVTIDVERDCYSGECLEDCVNLLCGISQGGIDGEVNVYVEEV
ncbi:MAG: hypothetical protein ACYS7Y_34280 [Planctomycetota bacterium]|jgi:hypothetical protein